jgi:hypothetical protein
MTVPEVRTMREVIVICVGLSVLVAGCGPLVRPVESMEVAEAEPLPEDSGVMVEEAPEPAEALACHAEPVRIQAWSTEGISIGSRVEVVGADSTVSLICHAKHGTVKIVGEQGATYYPPTRAQDAGLRITEDSIEILVETESGERAECTMRVHIHGPQAPAEGVPI